MRSIEIGSATAQAVAKLQIAIRPLFSDECGLIREAAFSVEEYEP